MRSGTHNKKLDSSRWIRALETDKFNPRFFKDFNGVGTCGTNALSLITGISPRVVDKQMPKTNDYWTDKAMKSFLRKKGYEITEITVSRVTQSSEFEENPITAKHLLLISQEVCLGEGTWAVLYQGKKFHNFQQDNLSCFEFINNPLTAVYAISHPKLNNKPPKNYKIRYDFNRDKIVADET